MNNTLYCFENYGLRRIFALLVCCVPLMFSGCKETIDDSNFAIKTEMTAADFIDADDRFTMMRTLLKRVRMGDVEGASSLYSVLSARGNYTLFLPTDDAVTRFMAENGVASLEEMTDEQANLITKSCIIDNQNEDAYESADFPSSGSFSLPNLNNRLLSCLLNESAE